MRVFTSDYQPQLALQNEVTAYAASLMERGAERKRRILGLQDSAEAEALREEYLAAVRAAFPDELFRRRAMPRSAGVSRFDFDDFSITNYRIEALYGREANLSLYIPRDGAKSYRPVVMPTGHSAKTGGNYQGIAQFFAKCGYMVALFDSIGQGELAYNNDHFICGVTGYLVDIWSQTHFVGDALCVMDYLQTRADVDMSLGFAMTGVSGGGTTTLYCAMLDDRVRISAPSCCISPHKDIHFKDLYTTCPECFGSGYLRAGIDAGDYIWLSAPKPQLVLCGKYDTVFDVAATSEAFDEALKMYSLLGDGGNLRIFADDCPHAYSIAMAVKAVEFFDGYFGKEPSPNTREDTAITLLDGEMISSYPVKTVNMFEINRDKALQYDRRRANGQVSSPAEIREKLMSLLDLRDESFHAPSAEIDSGLPLRMGRRIDKVILSGQSRIKTPALLVYSPEAKKSPCLIFADDHGKFAGFKKDGFLSRVAAVTKNDASPEAVLSLELAGFGELTCENTPYDTVFWNDIVRILAYISVGTGRPVAHYWVKCLLDAKMYLDGTGRFAADFHIGGRGESAVAALLAAVVGKKLGLEVKKLLLVDMPSGYRCMTEHMPYRQSELLMIHGILKHFDLADLIAVLDGCEILLVNPRDGAHSGLSLCEAHRIFNQRSVPGLQILCCDRDEDIKGAIGAMFENR